MIPPRRLSGDSLRNRGHEAIAVAEVGWKAEDDESLLALCAGDQRTLLTNNVADFAVIARRWHTEGRSHHGLIFTADISLPRTRHNVGRYGRAIETLMKNPDVDSFRRPNPLALTTAIVGQSCTPRPKQQPVKTKALAIGAS